MQAPGAFLLEADRDRDRVVVVGRLFLRVAAEQANGAAAAQVDRRDHDHAAFTAFTKFS